MTSDTRIPGTKITGIYGGLVKMMARRMLGDVPDSAGVMWHYPAVFKDVMGFGRKADKWDRLDPSLASFATMVSRHGWVQLLPWTSTTSWRTTRAWTWPRRARCRGGASPTRSALWSAR